ncbi:MAG: DNA polymerase III subunit beta [Kiritimatiellae bacterium]|nr:DNA polymerase III subunit beta [Kiritimatiellia bacterium]
MKFKLHQSNFLEALNSVQSVVGSHATMPILSNVLIEAKGEDLTFTTTDLDLTTRFTCKAEIAEEGAITLPVKRLVSIVRVLSNQIVEVVSDPKQENAVRMTCGSYRSKIMGIDAKDFPPVVEADGVSFKLGQATFKEMLRKTSYAAATDDSRPILTGVLLSFADGKATAVATDSRRLALFWTEIEFPPDNARDVVLPARTVSELLRSLGDEDDVRISVKENAQVVFEYGNRFLSSKLMGGNYPDYKRVVFSNCDNKIKVNREELLAVLRRINVSTTPTTNAMRLAFENNLLTITVNSTDVEDATDTVTIKYDGAPITAVFNPEFMMEPLKNLTSDEVTIELNNATSPGLIKDDTTFLYVIMPLRI